MAHAAAAVSDDRVLRLEREFKAPPERVFAAFTDPKLFAQWWGPEGTVCAVCELDPRVGGRYRTLIRGETFEHWVSGAYREISPPRRLVFTWAWEENGVRGHETIVEIDFAPAGRNTRIALVQRTFATQEARDNHTKGWSSGFACLDQFLAGKPKQIPTGG